MHAKIAIMLTWAISVTCMLGAGTCHVGICNMHVETQHLFLMRLHWDSPRVAPAGERRYLFSVRFRYLAHAALGFSEPVSHGLGMTTYLAVVVPGY